MSKLNAGEETVVIVCFDLVNPLLNPGCECLLMYACLYVCVCVNVCMCVSVALVCVCVLCINECVDCEVC